MKNAWTSHFYTCIMKKKIKFFITTLLTLDCAYLFFIKSWSDIPFFHFPYSLASVCNENTSANSL